MLSFAYGLICYAMFVAVLLYLLAFVADVGVAKTVRNGPTSSLPSALVIDLALLALFGLQHSIMARKPFKSWLG